MNSIQLYDPDYVLILSGDHIYKMDYSQMLAHHKANNAACTISVLEVPMKEASRFGIMNVNADDQVYEFEEKPKQPKSNLASMGIYIFTWSKLKEYLMADEADENSVNDFGKNIIPAMLANQEKLMAYRFRGYWKDVGTIDSLWDANMDMLSPENGIDPYDTEWPIFARTPTKPPLYTGETAHVVHSMVTGGCEVYGHVENSVLFHSVIVEEGPRVLFHPHARHCGEGRGCGGIRHHRRKYRCGCGRPGGNAATGRGQRGLGDRSGGSGPHRGRWCSGPCKGHGHLQCGRR